MHKCIDYRLSIRLSMEQWHFFTFNNTVSFICLWNIQYFPITKHIIQRIQQTSIPKLSVQYMYLLAQTEDMGFF